MALTEGKKDQRTKDKTLELNMMMMKHIDADRGGYTSQQKEGKMAKAPSPGLYILRYRKYRGVHAVRL